jgi:hypothetical protein
LNEEQSIFDLIEKYHQGLLSEDEKMFVEKRIQTDASFAEYVKINGLANTLVHSAGIDLLRERMSKDLAKLDRKRTRRKWGIGAGIVSALLVSASTIYFLTDTEKEIHSLPGIHKKQISTDRPGDKTNIVSETTSVENNVLRKSGLKQPEKKLMTDTSDSKNNSMSFSSTTEKGDTVDKVKILAGEHYKNSEQTKTKEDNQKESLLLFEVITHASCKGEVNGAIEVDKQSISGGVKPYRFRISNSNKESSTGAFSDLSKGNYIITMYDSKAYSHSKEVTVPEKNCTSKKSYSFNPTYGEIWKIPSMEGESGSFTIYNRAGIIIFKGSITGQDSTEWTGINSMGITVDAGLYVCVIEYSNGKSEIIEISIIR